MQGGEKTILHVLRDCPSIAGIWNRLVPVQRKQKFFNASLLKWIYKNLGIEEGSANAHGIHCLL